MTHPTFQWRKDVSDDNGMLLYKHFWLQTSSLETGMLETTNIHLPFPGSMGTHVKRYLEVGKKFEHVH